MPTLKKFSYTELGEMKSITWHQGIFGITSSAVSPKMNDQLVPPGTVGDFNILTQGIIGFEEIQT